jgi:signal transduction histidine kinase
MVARSVDGSKKYWITQSMERSRIRRVATRYATAILAVVAANLLRNVLHAMGDSGISPLYFAAVIFSAWFGGLGPGFLATALSGVATAYLLMPQAGTAGGFRDAVLRVLVFTVVAVLTSSLHAALKRAAEASRRARELAEEASAAKSRFLAMVSHELRGPLVPVAMVMDAMENDASLPTPVRRDAQMVRRSVNVELRLIDDLVDLSRIGSGKLNLKLERIDLHDPLAAAVEIALPDAHDAELDLQTELAATDSLVCADAVRLQQIFWNLIRNAIKFTAPGGRVRVRTRNAPDGNILVEVSDEGIGIEPEKLSRIFDAFEQAGPDIAARFGGLGLGLAISQGLAEAHGGTITAASAGLDQGTTFTVRLPAARTEVCPNPTANSDMARARGN